MCYAAGLVTPGMREVLTEAFRLDFEKFDVRELKEADKKSKFDAEVIDNIKYLMNHKGKRVKISEVVQHMADNRRHFQICDVSGQFWADVDTEEDHDSISALLKEGYDYGP